jgi:hypothetical protein
MLNRIIKLSFFICLVNISAAYSQNTFGASPSEQNAKVVEMCNRWLDTSGLAKILHVDSVKQAHQLSHFSGGLGVIGTRPRLPELNVYCSYTDYYKSPMLAWFYVKRGFKKRAIDIEQLIQYQVCDFFGATDSSLVVRLLIPMDDFSERGLGTNNYAKDFPYTQAIEMGFSNRFTVYRKITDLTSYYSPLSAYFKKYKHKSRDTVKVASLEKRENSLDLEISNIYGHVTGGNFYELIEIEVTMRSIKDDETEFFFEIKNIKYTGGTLAAPHSEDDYVDLDRASFKRKWDYFNQLKRDLPEIIK